MAIGSVLELVDYKQETIKIAKKYGGNTEEIEGRIDDVKDNIADTYNPNKTSGYNIGDLVIYEDKLYKCISTVSVGAGEFDSTKWDAIPTYDSTQTYNEYDYVIYEGVPYRCDEANTTGDWDSSKWTDVSIEFAEYDETASYYTGSRVEYDGGYYKANATYTNAGTVGEFNTNRWSETTVEEIINELRPKSFTLIPAASSITTDANGYLKWTVQTTGGMTPLALIGGNTQPNTGAYFELCASSYMWATGQLIVKVTDNTGAPLKNTTLNAYMAGLLTLVYLGSTITSITQVANE